MSVSEHAQDQTTAAVIKVVNSTCALSALTSQNVCSGKGQFGPGLSGFKVRLGANTTLTIFLKTGLFTPPPPPPSWLQITVDVLTWNILKHQPQYFFVFLSDPSRSAFSLCLSFIRIICIVSLNSSLSFNFIWLFPVRHLTSHGWMDSREGAGLGQYHFLHLP